MTNWPPRRKGESFLEYARRMMSPSYKRASADLMRILDGFDKIPIEGQEQQIVVKHEQHLYPTVFSTPGVFD